MSIREHLAAWVAAVVFFVIGAVWYGQFQTAWLAGIGKTLEGLTAEQGSSPLPYAIGFGAILVMCYSLSWLFGRMGVRGIGSGMLAGASIALGFLAAMLALNYGFESRGLGLWLINTGYALVGLTLAGGIIGGWKRAPA